MKRRVAGAIGALFFGGVFNPAAFAGVDGSPGDYTPLPPGTTIALQYGQWASRDGLTFTDGSKVDASLDSLVGFTRIVHYMDIGGFTVDPQIVIPYGRLYDGSIGGAPLESAGGLGDILIGATTWVINKPDQNYSTFVGLTPWLWLPTGQYDNSQLLNIGENRWKFDFQVGFIQGLGNGFTFDIYGDVTWFGENNDRNLEQDNSYEVQTSLRYALAPTTTIYGAYAQYWGGNQYVGGVHNGLSTEWKELRAGFQHFLDPTLQLETAVVREFDQDGGFERDWQINIRFLKILPKL